MGSLIIANLYPDKITIFVWHETALQRFLTENVINQNPKAAIWNPPPHLHPTPLPSSCSHNLGVVGILKQSHSWGEVGRNGTPLTANFSSRTSQWLYQTLLRQHGNLRCFHPPFFLSSFTWGRWFHHLIALPNLPVPSLFSLTGVAPIQILVLFNAILASASQTNTRSSSKCWRTMRSSGEVKDNNNSKILSSSKSNLS